MAHRVTVNANQVKLPNGGTYNTGAVVVLEDEEFSLLSPTAFTGGSPVLTDNGELGGGAVSAQATDVANVGALTAVAVSTTNAVDLATAEALANANKVQINALVADVATLRTALNSLLTNLRVTGGPMV